MSSQLASELGRLATISVLPPSSLQASATFCSSAALLADSTTLALAPASTLAASAPNAPDAPVTIAVLPRTSNSESGFFKKSSDMVFHRCWYIPPPERRRVGWGSADYTQTKAAKNDPHRLTSF